jgi:hypothetical protein
MSENTATPAKTIVRNCQCMLGWTGTAGSGSTLAMAEDPGVVCDRETRKSFAQGHDARMASRLATEVANGETPLEVARKLVRMAGGTIALESKMAHSAKLRAEKAARKVDTEQAAPTAVDEGDDEMAAAGAENMASDEGIALNVARERLGLEPLEDPAADQAPGASEDNDADQAPEPPALGTAWKVTHGKRRLNANVIETHTGERVAAHKMGAAGNDCYHDLATGEIIEIDSEDVDTPDF